MKEGRTLPYISLIRHPVTCMENVSAMRLLTGETKVIPVQQVRRVRKVTRERKERREQTGHQQRGLPELLLPVPVRVPYP